MLDTGTVFLVVGAVLPFIVDILSRIPFLKSDNAKKIVVILLSLIGGYLIEYSKGLVTNFNELLGSFAIVLGTSQIVFKNLYNDTSLASLLRGDKKAVVKTVTV